MDFVPKSRKAHSRNSKRIIHSNKEQFIKRVSRVSPFGGTNSNLGKCYYHGRSYNGDSTFDNVPSELANWDYCAHIYNGNRPFNWKEPYKETIQRAREDAITHLKNALSNSLINGNIIIRNAIQEVKESLENKAFVICPFFGCSTDGLAEAGAYKISIRTTLIRDIVCGKVDQFRLAKTLIHETFHIIGGCTKEQSNDSICLDKVSRDDAFEKIASKDNIESMEADDFAQFVMMC